MWDLGSIRDLLHRHTLFATWNGMPDSVFSVDYGISLGELKRLIVELDNCIDLRYKGD